MDTHSKDVLSRLGFSSSGLATACRVKNRRGMGGVEEKREKAEEGTNGSAAGIQKGSAQQIGSWCG